jgi:hypothetical protein
MKHTIVKTSHFKLTNEMLKEVDAVRFRQTCHNSHQLTLSVSAARTYGAL